MRSKRLAGLAALSMLAMGCVADGDGESDGEPGQTVSAIGGADSTLPVVGISITKENDKDRLCSGILIAKDRVLTMKDCVGDAEPRRVDVFYGASDGQFTTPRAGKGWIQKKDKLAIIRLREPFNGPIAKIHDQEPSFSWTGEEVRIAGYGTDSRLKEELTQIKSMKAGADGDPSCLLDSGEVDGAAGDWGGGIFKNGKLVGVLDEGNDHHGFLFLSRDAKGTFLLPRYKAWLDKHKSGGDAGGDGGGSSADSGFSFLW